MARYSREAAEEILGVSLDPTIKYVTLSLSNDKVKEDEPIDIRVEAEKLERAILIFQELNIHDLARQSILLKQYIMDTWNMERDLEERADYIHTESMSLNTALRELHEGEK